jgi:predicted nucleic acid-binding protein
MTTRFFDTNVLAYLAGSDPAKAARARAVLAEGGMISVQVLNELINVCRRKVRMDWPEVREFVAGIRTFLTVTPVTVETHDLGLTLAERHQLRVWDAMIAAAALRAGCTVLLSEDFQPGFVFAGRMTVQNPFAAA